MSRLQWYVNRLKTMNLGEVVWRLQQKTLQIQEQSSLYKKHIPVYSVHRKASLKGLEADYKRIQINDESRIMSRFEGLSLFDVFDYAQYESDWLAGFQTENQWPSNVYSPQLNISGREDIGDVRTNWELNRHFQFSALAKSYYVSGEVEDIEHLKTLFYAWNEKNLFLHGVSWTSAMEVAIRLNSWIYTLCFLEKAAGKYDCKEEQMIADLKNGIVTMADYIVSHQARFSSANNHLVVEMYAVGLAGILFLYQPWIEQALSVLTRELHRQNCTDGVNKEMSLHYQAFVMEAYGLIALNLLHNNMRVPKEWIERLSRMSEYLVACRGQFGETIVFGDDDAGQILNLCGKRTNYYIYVLALMSSFLPQKYLEMDSVQDENISWVVTDAQLDVMQIKPYGIKHQMLHSFVEGGYTIIKDIENGVCVGFDHAPLGFGVIAAHGHADALSFQMFVSGQPVFVDAGTYNYHVPNATRNVFRATSSHNTVEVDGKNQAEMLGAFLWGERYETRLVLAKELDSGCICEAEVLYSGITHKRRLEWENRGCLSITDTVEGGGIKKQNFLIHPNCEIIKQNKKTILVRNSRTKIRLTTHSDGEMSIQEYEYSAHYNHIQLGQKIVISSQDSEIKTIIELKVDEY